MKGLIRSFGSGFVVLLALSTVGCKLKLEASMKGFKESSPDIAIVHVVSERDADINCSAPSCSSKKVPYSGEVDLEIPMPSGDAPKTVFVTGKKGPRKNQVLVDLAGKGIPAKLAVDTDHGTISCPPRACSGAIALVPSSNVSLTTEPGTLLQIGTDKLTAGPDGTIKGPLALPLSPSLEKQPLDKICLGLTFDQPKRPITTVPVTMTFPDKTTATTTAELDVELMEKSLSTMLADVTKGPVLFPWEKPGQAAKGKRAAVFVYSNDCYDAGAAGATVGDLDVVAVAENSTRTGECTYTSKSSTATGKMTMYDLKATVYDRITGRKLATKLFPAPKDCRDTFTARAGTTIAPESTSFVDKEGVAKWAAAFAR
jgi:hypothetical protein